MLKKKGIKNVDMNERYSQSMNNMRRSSIRISDCSENITEASGEKKDQFFQTNYMNEIHNIKLIRIPYYEIGNINLKMLELKNLNGD